ncbi:MAG: iron chelate uptake ABC transporter family permease subunit, partial [Pseudomonadota bacterium]
LDVEHALFGNLESLIWFDGLGWASLLDPSALLQLPPELFRMASVAVIMTIVTIVFWRPLVIATFDEAFAASVGIPVTLLSLMLVVFAAIAAVAAFDAVGSIIVIAMFICPPATARLLTDRMGTQVLISALVAAVCAVLGYVAAGYGPLWLGFDNSVSASGMIATVSGVALGLAVAFGPRRRQVAG